MKSLISLLFFICINFVVFSQEVLNDLFVNPILINKKQPTTLKSTKAALELPFFDDFSIISGYPSTDLWENMDVFVNTTYGNNPPSIGVATFDAVDSYGFVYPSLTTSASPADKLTSHLINLSNANHDSTYLSFYYQPQGNGDEPDPEDSLVLNVISEDSVFRIWYATGITYKSFIKDSLKISADSPDTLEFKLVHLKLDNPYFFKSSFKLQFVNYASIGHNNNLSERTNADHWNVDYIYLNEGRSQSDTIFKDLAMVETSSLFMKDYSSVPWSHFNEAITKQFTDINFHIRNNGSKERKMNSLNVFIKDIGKNIVYDYYQIGLSTFSPYANRTDLSTGNTNHPVNWYQADSAIFEISSEMEPAEYDSVDNNFTSRIVKYKDYYSYDDGTAEKAYGNDNERARVAYRYDLAKGDSLRSVQMYFVRNIDNEASVQTFTLCIWDDKNNMPGDIIRKESGKRPEYSDNLNEFITIPLDSALYLDGIIYIGWEQNSDLLMNVGFDANTYRKDKFFYNISSEWYASEFKGSLMMRPVFGSKPLNTSIAEKSIKKALQIAPNPSNGTISIINQPESLDGLVAIYNCLGIKVFEKEISTSETLDVNHLINGMYIVTFTPDKGALTSTRLIITK